MNEGLSGRSAESTMAAARHMGRGISRGPENHHNAHCRHPLLALSTEDCFRTIVLPQSIPYYSIIMTVFTCLRLPPQPPDGEVLIIR